MQVDTDNFFQGSQYWKFENMVAQSGYPKSIEEVSTEYFLK